MIPVQSCPKCYATVQSEHLEIHQRWHVHLDRLIDIAAGGGRAASLSWSERRAVKRRARRA